MQFCVRVKENSVIVDKVEPSTHVDKECQTWVTEPRRTATFKGDVILDTSKSCAMKMADDNKTYGSIAAGTDSLVTMYASHGRMLTTK